MYSISVSVIKVHRSCFLWESAENQFINPCYFVHRFYEGKIKEGKSLCKVLIPASEVSRFVSRLPSQTEELLFYPTWCGHYYCTANFYEARQLSPLLIAYIRKGRFRVEYRSEFHVAGPVTCCCSTASRAALLPPRTDWVRVQRTLRGSNARELCHPHH